MYVWGFNSTVIKHSGYLIGKDTSERVARRCDDIGWQEASEFMCTKTPLWGSSATKKSPKNPWNGFSDALIILRFQKFATGKICGLQNITAFLKPRFVRNSRITQLTWGLTFWEVSFFAGPKTSLMPWDDERRSKLRIFKLSKICIPTLACFWSSYVRTKKEMKIIVSSIAVPTSLRVVKSRQDLKRA